MAQENGKKSGEDWSFDIDLESIRAELARHAENSDDAGYSETDVSEKGTGANATPPSAGAQTKTSGSGASEPDDIKPTEDETNGEDFVSDSTRVVKTTSEISSDRSRRLNSQPGRQEYTGSPRPREVRGTVSKESRKGVDKAQENYEKNGGAKKASLTPRQQKKLLKAQKKREKRLKRVERSRERPKFRFAPVLASLLAITNVITLGSLGLKTIQTRITVQEADASVKSAEAAASSAQEEADQLKKDSIPIDTFTENVANFNVSAEFIQAFFDDRIVYKDTSVHYAEIDESLPMNDYDWSALSWEDGRPSYTPADSRHAVLGVDVSYHQGDIDWAAVAADGVSFAMIRCGYRGYGTGELMTDSNYAGYMQGALDNGLKTGVYFFSQALTADEAVEEADYVLELISGYDVTMPVVYDMEIIQEDARANDLTSSQRAEAARAFCDRIKEAGYTPMIYGNTAYYMSKIDYSEIAADYGIWLAQYYETPFFPYQFTMWQYTNTGSVDGIDGEVDLNLYFGE